MTLIQVYASKLVKDLAFFCGFVGRGRAGQVQVCRDKVAIVNF